MDTQTFDIAVTRSIRYTESGKLELLADLYRPVTAVRTPVVISIHGGNWDGGSRRSHEGWGRYLSSRGFAVFAIDRRHFTVDEAAYPGVIEDFLAAIAFVVANSDPLGLDPERIAVLGDSSGAYIATLTGLILPELIPNLSSQKQRIAEFPPIRAILGIYGTYDLASEWSFEKTARPLHSSAEKLLGRSLVEDRTSYFEASPIAYATLGRNSTPVFLAWGTEDDVVSEKLHSKPFSIALAQANFAVTTMEIPSAQHYWFTDPIEEKNSHSGALAPILLRFLHKTLGPVIKVSAMEPGADEINVSLTIEIPGEAKSVWGLLGSFGELPLISSGTKSSELTSGGRVRVLTNFDGSILKEQLLEFSEERMMLSYDIFHTENFQAAYDVGYRGKVTVRPIGSEVSAFEYSASFKPTQGYSGEDARQAVVSFATDCAAGVVKILSDRKGSA